MKGEVRLKRLEQRAPDEACVLVVIRAQELPGPEELTANRTRSKFPILYVVQEGEHA